MVEIDNGDMNSHDDAIDGVAYKRFKKFLGMIDELNFPKKGYVRNNLE